MSPMMPTVPPLPRTAIGLAVSRFEFVSAPHGRHVVHRRRMMWDRRIQCPDARSWSSTLCELTMLSTKFPGESFPW